MYEERQCNYIYNQAHGIEQQDKQPQGNQKQITTTSSTKNTTGGATSSSTGKTTADGKGRNSTGRWTVYSGQGKPMELDTVKQKQ